ncbi:MAG: TfoX/Sxy family protein [Pseudomonadota bacterium]
MSDLERLTELFADLGKISVHPMMGAYAVYADGRIFAAIHRDGTLYFRSRGRLAEALRAEGAQAFEWVRPSDGQVRRMGYWSCPEAALDDPALACNLARQALAEG